MNRILAAVALGAFLFGAVAAPAAPPEVPLGVVYQGVLLDNLGQPRTGNVDLTLRIFDDASAGTLLYVQNYSAVALSDGAFSIVLGPTGAASDGAATPLTTSLGDVFAGELAATAPGRWLELQVGSSAALARTRLQAAPFALRAGSAESADFALEAETAANATGVGGIPSDVLSQIWDHTNLDGQGPVNSDPIEGLLDSDGDGVANFLEVDNDADGVLDGDEIAGGKDPNLSTPRPAEIQPARGLTFVSTPATVVGQGFATGISANLGGLALTPQSVTGTSFQVQIPAASFGGRALNVANPNGQAGQLLNAFIHADALAGGGTIDVHGAQQVLRVSGGGSYSVSTDSDFYTDASFPFIALPGSQQSLRWNAAGRVTALACIGTGSSCQVRLVTDSDGDFDLTDETGVPVEAPLVNTLGFARLAFDPSGRPAGGYVKRQTNGTIVPVVFHDRDGDGLFTGANERVELSNLPGFPGFGVAAVDPLGRVAFLYQQGAAQSTLLTAYDRSGDGDFDDLIGGGTEIFSYPAATLPSCVGATFDGSGRLTALVGAGAGPLKLGRDLNGDGNWAAFGELTDLPTSSHCDVASGPGVPLAVSSAEAGDLRLLRDLNGDLDFGDTDESRLLVTLSTPFSQSARVGSAGQVFVGTLEELAISAP